AEVELQDVVPTLQPRHEARQPRQAMPREAVQQDYRSTRLACGGHQPAGEGPAVIGREATVLVLQADLRGRRRIPLLLRHERAPAGADDAPRPLDRQVT